MPGGVTGKACEGLPMLIVKEGMMKSIIVLSLALILSICAFSQAQENLSSQVDGFIALEKMGIAFNGNYSKAEIKKSMDKAMKLYNLTINEENYNRAASVLIVMRKEYNITEMDILDYMIRSYVPNSGMDFQSMAAISTVFLSENIE